MSNLSSINTQKFIGHNDVTVSKNTGAGASTLVTPAANTSGIIVYHGGILAGSTTQFGNLVYDTSAPASYSDGNPLIIYYGNFYVTNYMTSPLLIPAGQGLYAYSSHSSVTVSAIYEVL